MQKIFVGDVQGCADELEELIERATAKYGDEFELLIVGDLVNRGPGNLRALERVRALCDAGRATMILGNHEIFLICVALGLREIRPHDSIEDVLAASDAEDWIDWLRARPLAVTGEIEGQPFAMVHASVHPEWDLETLRSRADAVSQALSGPLDLTRAFLASEAVMGSARDDLGRMTRCRSVTSQGGWSSEEPATPDAAWHAVWSKQGHAYGIVYGHWARQGLHFATGLRGLDTGCVHHGRGRDGFLTAWLPESSGASASRRAFDVPDDRIWQIPARRRYYDVE